MNQSHWWSVICSSSEIQETVRSDIVVRQRAKNLKLRCREEGVTLLLQRHFCSAVDTYDPQLSIIIR